MESDSEATRTTNGDKCKESDQFQQVAQASYNPLALKLYSGRTGKADKAKVESLQYSDSDVELTEEDEKRLDEHMKPYQEKTKSLDQQYAYVTIQLMKALQEPSTPISENASESEMAEDDLTWDDKENMGAYEEEVMEIDELEISADANPRGNQ